MRLAGPDVVPGEKFGCPQEYCAGPQSRGGPEERAFSKKTTGISPGRARSESTAPSGASEGTGSAGHGASVAVAPDQRRRAAAASAQSPQWPSRQSGYAGRGRFPWLPGDAILTSGKQAWAGSPWSKGKKS